MGLITQAEYARQRGVSRPYISKLIKKGVVTLVNGRIDPVRAERQIAESSDPVRSTIRKTGDKTDKTKQEYISLPSQGQSNVHQTLLKARAKREIYRAEREQLECEKEKGKLIEAEIVTKELEKVFAAFRSRLLALPVKLASAVLSMESLPEVKEALESGVNECLRELSAPEFDYKENKKAAGSAAETDSK